MTITLVRESFLARVSNIIFNTACAKCRFRARSVEKSSLIHVDGTGDRCTGVFVALA